MEKVEKLRTQEFTTPFNLYETLVEAWEFICAENTAQLNLVTADQKETWLSFKDSTTRKLIAFGEDFKKTGETDEEALKAFKNTMLAFNHVPEDVLKQRKAEAERKVAEDAAAAARLKAPRQKRAERKADALRKKTAKKGSVSILKRLKKLLNVGR